jgi:hypothetical protein
VVEEEEEEEEVEVEGEGFPDAIRVEGEGILRIPGAFWIVHEEGSEGHPRA